MTSHACCGNIIQFLRKESLCPFKSRCKLDRNPQKRVDSNCELPSIAFQGRVLLVRTEARCGQSIGGLRLTVLLIVRMERYKSLISALYIDRLCCYIWKCKMILWKFYSCNLCSVG